MEGLGAMPVLSNLGVTPKGQHPERKAVNRAGCNEGTRGAHRFVNSTVPEKA